MKLYFGVENLRSVNVTPPFELRPISILLGRNNVGKSTLLQTFPLLRQSTLKKQIGPLYWKGEVDFGDYTTAVMQNRESDGILFSFGCNNLSISAKEYFRNSEWRKTLADEMLDEIKTSRLQILLKGIDGNAVREKTTLTLPEFDVRVDFNFSNSGSIRDVLVNGQELPDKFGNTSFEFPSDELLPSIRTSFESDIANVSGFRDVLATNLSVFIDKSIQSNTRGEVSNSESAYEVTRILSSPRFNSERISLLANSVKSENLKPFYANLESDQKLVMEIDLICIFYSAMVVYDKITGVFCDVINNSTYIGPSRAKSKRYHEISNLDVSELRVDGENLPEMLGSIDNSMLVEFSNWLNNHFDFGIHVEKRNGHISIFTKKGDKQVNFADSGFGISQLVPVALQVWWDLNSLGKYSYPSVKDQNDASSYKQISTKVLAVEQPELHLHPAHQAKLADLFANSVRLAREMKNNIKPAYIIETHSEPLVNRLGELIEDGIVSSEDVQILMFSKKNNDLTSPTSVERIKYNTKGYLEKWPYGFFRYKHVS